MALSAEQVAALATELASDPASLGYAAHVAAGRDGDIEALINATTGPGVGTITLASVTRNQFIKGLMPAVLTLAGKDAATKDKWDRALSAVTAADPITIDASNLYFLGLVAADGLLTSNQAEAIYKRAGSRAEVLFGAGTHVDTSDIAKALRG